MWSGHLWRSEWHCAIVPRKVEKRIGVDSRRAEVPSSYPWVFLLMYSSYKFLHIIHVLSKSSILNVVGLLQSIG
jgi:hypothetical protein